MSGAWTAVAVFTAVSATHQYQQARSAANRAEDAAINAQRQAREQAALMETQAQEKHDAEISMAQEVLDFRQESSRESADFTKSQIAKRDKMLEQAAMVHYGGVNLDPLENETSSFQVIKRIVDESKVEQGQVERGHEVFVEGTNITFEQFTKTRDLGLDWFTSRTKMGLRHTVENKTAEAAAWRSKGRAAGVKLGIDLAGAAYSGYRGYSKATGAGSPGFDQDAADRRWGTNNDDYLLE